MREINAGDRKKFLYVPSFGFYEIVHEEIRKTTDDKLEVLTERTVDQIIMERLQKEHPGCKIIQVGNRWDIIPNEEI